VRSLPFTPDVFLFLFETYNRAIWPAQLVAYALGVAALLLALRPLPAGGRLVFAILAAFWLWNGIAYHWLHFLEINFAAAGFGALFVLQGALFAVAALAGRRSVRFRRDVSGWSGLFLALFALLVYPWLAWLAGHGWPRAAVFGVAPCPTVIFTLGMLLMVEGRAPLALAAIPFLWSLIGGSAVFLLGIPEDVFLPVAGLVGFGLLVRKARQREPGLMAMSRTPS
jgi:hypothetical protein